MSSKQKSERANDLLAAIQRKAPTNANPVAETPEVPEPSAAELVSPQAPTRKPAKPVTVKSRIGKPVQFWLHEEDRRLVRELHAWLAGQGERPTDSMVIRCALRMAHTGGDLLKAYRQAAQLDGRLKQHRPA